MSNASKKAVTPAAAPDYDIAKSQETMHLAIDLARFIKENKLFMNIQGKAYVNVEGWQYAGARLGILPIIDELTPLHASQGGSEEIKYQARVSLLNLKSDQIVGSGYAICSNRESGKKFYQEFAIASMAQTRAIGKAYRNILAWIIRAAGYEPTPAEEMEYLGGTPLGGTPLGGTPLGGTPLGGTPLGGTPQKGGTVNNAAATPRTTSPKRIAKPVQNAPAATAANSKQEAPAQPEVGQPEAGRQSTEQPPAPEGQPAKSATAKQKADILLLLNNDVITKVEKERMVNSINKIDRERAAKAIENLKKTIAARQQPEEKKAA